MRPVYFYGAMSLDGYLATADDDLQWLLDADVGGVDTYRDFAARIDTLVMGRATYDWLLAAMPGQALYPDCAKVVLTHRPAAAVPGTAFVAETTADAVRRLREAPGRGIWIVGGGRVVADLLAADLIDELWVQIVPVLLGGGKPLFPAGDYRRRFAVADRTAMGELTELHLVRQPE
ncbi:dihydrofolate reductase family protein [Lacticaseibacillus kribbianus]|uniref:dihydrofolate reductase family protein n=1 Tax=Lacticaseibacillus kribbianus TaxID=2926292 RepID=UPI001CD38308|nr:dihydrofolate reductase family protein [Lacticaseibacillus kribbianus]